MNDLQNDTPRHSGALLGAIAVSLLAAIGGLVWSYTLASRLGHQEAALTAAHDQNSKLAAELNQTNARLKVATQELGQSLGLTQKQLDAKAEQILAKQQQEQAATEKLASAQKQTAEQVGQVSNEVSSVKTDVGSVKTDVTKTQADLANTSSQLQSMKGDLGLQSGLIARNHDELELLKHRGDRNYYEFRLNKGDKLPVATVSLELRKADPKKSRFTLEVYADDRKYEKKDKNVNEPLQFYTGKDNYLYEIVVNSINSKNQIVGYVSTPKSAPAPVTP